VSRMRQAFMRVQPRVRGSLTLVVGLISAAIFIGVPITLASQGRSFTWFPVLALLATMCMFVGAFLLVFGHRGDEWLSAAPGAGMDYNNLSGRQVAVILGMAAPAVLLVFLFNSYLTRLAAP
jgi:hypothetical protein